MTDDQSMMVILGVIFLGIIILLRFAFHDDGKE